MQPMNVQINSTVRVPETVAFQVLNGEAMLLNFDTGKYYGLDEIGTRMFTLLKEQANVESVLRSLLNEYEVGQDRLEADLLKLVNDLLRNGLLVVDVA